MFSGKHVHMFEKSYVFLYKSRTCFSRKSYKENKTHKKIDNKPDQQ